MDFESGSSSDSEIESKIKLIPVKKKADTKLCDICQESGILVKSQQKSKQRFIESTKIRMDICQGNDTKLLHVFSNLNSIIHQESFDWHKTCYKSYTSSKNISSYKLKYAKIITGLELPADIPQKRIVRIQFDVTRCVFCQKRLRNQKLCQVMTKNMEDKIKNIARNNPIFYSRIGESDLIASEIKYHASCVCTELRNTNIKAQQEISARGKRKLDDDNESLEQLLSEMEQGFKKGKRVFYNSS